MYHSTNDAEQKACHMPYRRIPSQKKHWYKVSDDLSKADEDCYHWE